MQDRIYTIGHSTHTLEVFAALLRQHRITAICDVRSMPYSRQNPQFNREPLEQALLSQNIAYRFLGKELGARSDDPGCYRDGQVQYEMLAKTAPFRYGLKRLVRGMRDDFRIALMCAEKEPVECHRTILVARCLDELGLAVHHIHADGRLEDHDSTMSRLARDLGLPLYSMFNSREELLGEVYRRQAERIAYEAEVQEIGAGAAVNSEMP